MDVAAIEMEAEDAKTALRDYRQALKERPAQARDDAERELEKIDAAVMRGYRELARGRRIVELSAVVAAGGTMDVEWQGLRWVGDHREQETRVSVMPKIAVCRADSQYAFTRGVQRDGSVEFNAGGSRRKSDTVQTLAASFATPDSDQTWTQMFRTMVPTIPPALRPPHKLGGYHILWEVESWETAVAPGDPALLKHLGGDLYALLAVWDLTALERAVLAGTRR